ncbi:AGE family epimerase/isomerase [Acetobacter vaccinii]|uniref:Mannose-6-phosphate isomerase n=1 Tax=Acetobacter vaccinii TaxID=2592655 RepID=A0A5C1YMY0_9PROT|nr:AGE family epimerase/isomerase [Acetobacter vaccinii]QEO16620.1 mannose-6-phosphate isomerase [Acetobacter vaccinii]
MTAPASSLGAARERFAHWLFGQALPVWASVGCDGDKTAPALLGAQECLTLAGEPAFPGFKRVRVQARQLFVFSWAALRGWPEGAARAEGIFRFLLHARQADGGWARRLSRTGAVLDPTADLYDLAFVVFALAWYGRLEGSSGQAVQSARATLGWIVQAMSLPDGGFLNCLPDAGEDRQQNPHMHLFEAVLALYQTTGDEKDLALAHAIYALFSTRFQDAETGTLGEYFGPDWQPAAGAAGQWVEPGHHFEWVWLLHAYRGLTGVDTTRQAHALYSFARQHGVAAATGLVHDALDRHGTVIKDGFRLWVQGEALRGLLSHAPEQDAALAVTVATNLLDRYFINCPPGTWIDQLDGQGRGVADRIPTSSLYHIVTAYESLDQAVGHGATGGG